MNNFPFSDLAFFVLDIPPIITDIVDCRVVRCCKTGHDSEGLPCSYWKVFIEIVQKCLYSQGISGVVGIFTYISVAFMAYSYNQVAFVEVPDITVGICHRGRLFPLNLRVYSAELSTMGSLEFPVRLTV